MTRKHEEKKSIHFNNRLGSTKLIMDFYEQTNDGRSFSSFTKDILLQQAQLHFGGQLHQIVQVPTIPQTLPSAGNKVAPKAPSESTPPEKTMVAEEVESDEKPVKTDIASAAANMFGTS